MSKINDLHPTFTRFAVEPYTPTIGAVIHDLDLRQPLGNWARLALQPARPAAPYRDQLAGFASLQARLQSAGLQVHQPSPPINVAPTAVLDGRHPLLDAQARFMLTVRLPPATHAKTAR